MQSLSGPRTGLRPIESDSEQALLARLNLSSCSRTSHSNEWVFEKGRFHQERLLVIQCNCSAADKHSPRRPWRFQSLRVEYERGFFGQTRLAVVRRSVLVESIQGLGRLTRSRRGSFRMRPWRKEKRVDMKEKRRNKSKVVFVVKTLLHLVGRGPFMYFSIFSHSIGPPGPAVLSVTLVTLQFVLCRHSLDSL